MTDGTAPEPDPAQQADDGGQDEAEEHRQHERDEDVADEIEGGDEHDADGEGQEAAQAGERGGRHLGGWGRTASSIDMRRKTPRRDGTAADTHAVNVFGGISPKVFTAPSYILGEFPAYIAVFPRIAAYFSLS